MKKSSQFVEKQGQLSDCPNCGGRWIHLHYRDSEFACDTCCMHLVHGKLISKDCECEEHERGLIFYKERDGYILNPIQESLMQIKENYGIDYENGEEFEVIHLVDRLVHEGLISWDMHHLFISEERSFGGIMGRIQNGKFAYLDIDCSQFNEENPPSEPEEEMYVYIENQINQFL